MRNYTVVASEGWTSYDGVYRENYSNSLYYNSLCVAWYSHTTESYHTQGYGSYATDSLITDIQKCLNNFDMLLFEGNPLALWLSEVPIGTKFYNNTPVCIVTHRLTEKGLEEYID